MHGSICLDTIPRVSHTGSHEGDERLYDRPALGWIAAYSTRHTMWRREKAAAARTARTAADEALAIERADQPSEHFAFDLSDLPTVARLECDLDTATSDIDRCESLVRIRRLELKSLQGVMSHESDNDGRGQVGVSIGVNATEVRYSERPRVRANTPGDDNDLDLLNDLDRSGRAPSHFTSAMDARHGSGSTECYSIKPDGSREVFTPPMSDDDARLARKSAPRTQMSRKDRLAARNAKLAPAA